MSCDLFGPTFVLHRIYRTPVGYLAILKRRPVTDRELQFNINRNGFGTYWYEGKHRDTFRIQPDALADYEAAQNTVKTRARWVLNAFQDLPPDRKAQWSRQFRNLDFDQLAARLATT